LRGWGIKGERLKGCAPDGRWHTLTFLAALRADALTAPCVVEGPINGAIFRAYIDPIEQVFAKVKHCLRMPQARSLDPIHATVARLVSAISSTECANYIRNAGYASN